MYSQGQKEEAIKLLTYFFETAQSTQQIDQSKLVSASTYLSTYYFKKGDHVNALVPLQFQFDHLKKSKGVQNEETLTTQRFLAASKHMSGDYTGSKELFQEILKQRLKMEGENEKSIEIRLLLGGAFLKLGKISQAEKQLTTYMDFHSTHQSPYDYTAYLAAVAYLYFQNNQFDISLSYVRKAKKIALNANPAGSRVKELDGFSGLVMLHKAISLKKSDPEAYKELIKKSGKLIKESSVWLIENRGVIPKESRVAQLRLSQSGLIEWLNEAGSKQEIEEWKKRFGLGD